MNNVKPMRKQDGTVVKLMVFDQCGVVCVTTVLLIVASVLFAFAKQYSVDFSFTLGNIVKALSLCAGRYFGNAVFIALIVTVLGTDGAFMAAYIAARRNLKAPRFLHL